MLPQTTGGGPMPRRIFAKGWSACGRLRVTGDLRPYTCAALFRPGAETRCFARFSTLFGEPGSPDARRGLRGIALRFHTAEGDWDLAGSSSPAFYFRSAADFAALCRALERDPDTGQRSARRAWELLTRRPEALLQLTLLLGDGGIPLDFRHMDGYGGHTYSLYAASGERFWCRFHLRTRQGAAFLTDAQARRLAARSPDCHGRDLYDAIRRGEFPRWGFYLQVMPWEQALSRPESPFDVTRPWRESEFPLLEVGELTLDHIPRGCFARAERALFQPGRLVPGIGLSPDPLLQARAAACGADRGSAPPAGAALLPWRGPVGSDFLAPGEHWRALSPGAQERLLQNTAAAMADAARPAKLRHAAHCLRADAVYGVRMAQALSLDVSAVRALAGCADAQG